MNLSKANFTACEKRHSEVFQIKKYIYIYKILAWNGLIESVCVCVHVGARVRVGGCAMTAEPLSARAASYSM